MMTRQANKDVNNVRTITLSDGLIILAFPRTSSVFAVMASDEAALATKWLIDCTPLSPKITLARRRQQTTLHFDAARSRLLSFRALVAELRLRSIHLHVFFTNFSPAGRRYLSAQRAWRDPSPCSPIARSMREAQER